MTKKKQTILLAAISVLKAEGGASFSMRKVASEAGISLGNLQYHFPTLEDLLSGLLCNFIEEYRKELKGLQTREQISEAEFVEIIKKIVVEESYNDGFPLLRAIFLVSDDHWIHKQLVSYYSELFDLLKELIENVRIEHKQNPEKRQRAINTAASIILPFLSGYGLVEGVVSVSSNELIKHICQSALAELQ